MDQTRCERRLWIRGEQRSCAIEFGVTIWTDQTGQKRAACRHHLAEVRHRYPVIASEAVIDARWERSKAELDALILADIEAGER